MTRALFLGPLLAVLATNPARATGRKYVMTIDSVLSDVRAAGARATAMTVRHVGAYTSTLVEITPEKLARLKPTADVHDRHVIAGALDAIEAAEPASTSEMSEQRWHLTFADDAGTTLLVVTSSIPAPRHGTIDGRHVVFANDTLVRYLATHFAPSEAGA